jgi:hypothetical protein
LPLFYGLWQQSWFKSLFSYKYCRPIHTIKTNNTFFDADIERIKKAKGDGD